MGSRYCWKFVDHSKFCKASSWSTLRLPLYTRNKTAVHKTAVVLKKKVTYACCFVCALHLTFWSSAMYSFILGCSAVRVPIWSSSTYQVQHSEGGFYFFTGCISCEKPQETMLTKITGAEKALRSFHFHHRKWSTYIGTSARKERLGIEFYVFKRPDNLWKSYSKFEICTEGGRNLWTSQNILNY